MFVILTSRPGQYRTETGDGLEPHEAYDYLFCGQVRARFVIASLTRDTKVRVIDETPPERVNHVPSKFLPQFATLEQARAQLRTLISFGELDATLRRVA